ncbi:helix-turn-helix domain-containing protein [Streptomyces olivaceoviridis]|uniref:helix-turn-helix domain-containing protein n=1 Tax=Streptomyces olivaceoviridis TaxID=1921 RepID=UPI0027E4D7FF|nr:helix-turn-helix transcriptional regulator [Streptomyces olivaceoviridis]
MIDFGSQVRTALKEQGKSLRGAAKELHYDVAYLSRVLNGKQAPSPELTQLFKRIPRPISGCRRQQFP